MQFLFIVKGNFSKERRKAIGFILGLGLGISAAAQEIQADIQPDAISFTEGKTPVLTYQVAEKSISGTYGRANYIHPLHAMDGTVITEDFPADHLHHRGIFWAWHQVYVGDKRIGDGWEIRDFSWEVDTVQVLQQPGKARTLRTEVLWKSPGWVDGKGNPVPLVKENTTIIVYPAEASGRSIDLEIALTALVEDLRIGGSEDEKGYGGFSARIRLAGNMVFTGPKGNVEPDNLPVLAGGWLDISGPMGQGGAVAGLTVLSHPGNPGYPNPWILRASQSMQNAVYPYPGAKAVPLPASKPLVLRYRLWIHNGHVNPDAIDRIHTEYRQLE
ncbi:PmoA family protein [Robiginitalea sp. M366]|uniref:DUF6807 domain-containing protein n=1 Tax=Robiginitalea aestuariiviva TaxID=3036903 RepID=UPI00240CFB83|nr:PmoA family protein [Robiginitalea aestuariiviva]MDG1572671.1 PmoA family protein [Robiginitalea aestuariiviva]